MGRIVLMAFLALILGCSTYSTRTRPETENVIRAPVDLVWDVTLSVLKAENIEIKDVDESDLTLLGRRRLLWKWGDEVRVRLIPQGQARTLMHIEADVESGITSGEDSEQLARRIFSKVRYASEMRAK